MLNIQYQWLLCEQSAAKSLMLMIKSPDNIKTRAKGRAEGHLYPMKMSSQWYFLHVIFKKPWNVEKEIHSVSDSWCLIGSRWSSSCPGPSKVSTLKYSFLASVKTNITLRSLNLSPSRCTVYIKCSGPLSKKGSLLGTSKLEFAPWKTEVRWIIWTLGAF